MKEVDEEDFANLGERRARAVRDFLIEQALAAERLFICQRALLKTPKKRGSLGFLMK